MLMLNTHAFLQMGGYSELVYLVKFNLMNNLVVIHMFVLLRHYSSIYMHC